MQQNYYTAKFNLKERGQSNVENVYFRSSDMAGEWLLPPKIAFTIGLAFLRLPKSTSFPCQSVHEEMAHSNSVEKVLYARRAGNVKSMQRGRIKDMGGTLCAQIYMVYILLCIKY